MSYYVIKSPKSVNLNFCRIIIDIERPSTYIKNHRITTGYHNLSQRSPLVREFDSFSKLVLGNEMKGQKI